MLGKLISVIVDTATLPVSVTVDAVTLGGALVDRPEPYTVSKAKRIGKEVINAVEKIAE